jgi:Lanthionine synthetase C-like protein
MSNLLKVSLQTTIYSLAQRGWPQRRIAKEFEVNRETIGRDLRLSKPAISITGSLAEKGGSKPTISILRAFELTGDEQYAHEARDALRTTARSLRDATLPGFSLCHGIFGNAELLLTAAVILGDKTLVSL